MIPHAAPAVFASNPQFEEAYKHLCKEVLDADASTRSTNSEYINTSARLDAHRVAEAEDRILTACLADLYTSDQLPSDLRDIIVIVASYISEAGRIGLTLEEHDLVQDDINAFRSRLDDVVPALTQSLISQSSLLADLVSPALDSVTSSQVPGSATTGVSRLSSDSRELPSLVQSLISSVQHLRTEALSSAQYDAINALVSLLTSHAQNLQYLIRHLEQRKHGAEARHLSARAQFLSCVAQGLEAKTNATYLEQLSDVYTPQLRQSLAERMHALNEVEKIIAHRKQVLQTALAEYEDAGGDVMRTLGRKYGQMDEELQEITKDVERLQIQNRPGIEKT